MSLDRIVVHVGMPKTGSTALQDALSVNRTLLGRQGIWYPYTATRGSAHHPLAWAATKARLPRTDVPNLRSLLDGFERERRGGLRIGILSSEALFYVPGVEFGPITEWCATAARNVEVVAYVRPPAAIHESWYRQVVKTGDYARSFSDHLKLAPVIDTHAQLDKFQGDRRCTLVTRPYLPGTFANGNVVDDFSQTIGLGEIELDRPSDTDSNVSLDADVTEFKLHLNRAGVVHTPRLQRALVSWAQDRDPDDRSLFSEQEWSAFMTDYGPRHDKVLSNFSLPRELNDRTPRVFTETAMDTSRFQQMFDEFEKREPQISFDIASRLGGQ